MAMSLGYKIKSARELLGISQLTLAMKCGWDSQSRIGNYEQDLREPNIRDLKKLAKALERPLIYFLEGEDEGRIVDGSASQTLTEVEKNVLGMFKHLTASQQRGILNEIQAVYRLNEEVVATYRKRDGKESG
jgi:transcriptional regulator with XRE-family HTH domain